MKRVSTHLTPCTKINGLKNVRLETIKLLKENLGSKLPDISLGDNFLSPDTKSNSK